MSKELHKLIQLLDQEVNAENDGQLLEELQQLNLNKQEAFTGSSANGFKEKVEQELFAEKVKNEKVNNEAQLIQMFKRVAIPAAAAILFLVGLNWVEGTEINDLFSYQAQSDELLVNGVWDWSEEDY